MRKRLMIIATALLVAVALAAPVAAQEETTSEASFRGRGLLFAAGNGTADLDGRGTVRMVINGDVTIEDLAGDATVVIKSRPGEPDTQETVTSTIVLEDFEGYIALRGTDWALTAEGAMVLLARGGGTAELTGQGVWHTKHRFGFWSDEGSQVEIPS